MLPFIDYDEHLSAYYMNAFMSKWTSVSFKCIFLLIYFRFGLNFNKFYYLILFWSFCLVLSLWKLFYSYADLIIADDSLFLFSVIHLLWHRRSVIMVISEGMLHSHLLPSIWQWSCQYLPPTRGGWREGGRNFTSLFQCESLHKSLGKI